MKSYNIYNGLDPYDAREHQTHIDVLECDARVVCISAGRRWGKTFTAHLRFLDKFMRALSAEAGKIESGEKEEWTGVGLPRSVARRRYGDALEAVVISPFEKQLDHARGLIEHRLYYSGCNELLHKDPLLACSERPPENWFFLNGAAGVIRYFVSTRPSKLVGSKARLVWLNESGLQSNEVWRNVKPLLWESEETDVIAEGTPNQGGNHWFVKACVAGLPKTHERADPKIAKPRKDHKTFLGTSLNAYLQRVRIEAAQDLELSGKDSVYALVQILGDWRTPEIHVFNWDQHHHTCTLQFLRGDYMLSAEHGKWRLPAPDACIGGIDWYRGDAPAGFLEAKVWYENPCNPNIEDLRPLIVIDHDYTTPRTGYSDDSFFKKLVAGQDYRGVEGYHHDPTSVNIADAATTSGVALLDTSNADKIGRVGLVARQLHFNDEKNIKPAMYVSTKCKRTAEQLAGFKRAQDKEGNAKKDFVNYNDWLVDALAYIVPNVQTYGIEGAGF